MTSSGTRASAGLAALVLLVTGCSSTTNGTGGASTSLVTTAPPDFPTGVAGSPSLASLTPTAATSGPPASSTHPVPANPLKTVTVHAASGTDYVVKIWADVKDDSCFDHAYGRAMTDFLVKHPCRGLERYLGTTTVHGNPVGFAESVTSFAGTSKDPYVYANAFSRLEEADGTGSISDLLREGYRLPLGPQSVPASEAFNVLGQDNGVTVWDVWYLTDTTPQNDPALMQMTEDVFLQF